MSSFQITCENKKEEKEVIECPICYDEIDQLKNCVTTECGHQFHCKCLMQNSATNGFSCPMCRSIMATEPADSDSEGEYEEDEDEDEENDDNVLTSFRMFHQQLAGEEVEDEPEEELGEEDDQGLEEVEELIVKPTAEFIATKLLTQGYTMKDLVQCLLVDHEEYDVELETNGRYSDQIMFGKFRQIISNYPREMQEQAAAEEQLAQGHQSSRHRSRSEVETNIGCLQNRYHVLYNDGADAEDDDEDV
jgi:hypothetical protein